VLAFTRGVHLLALLLLVGTLVALVAVAPQIGQNADRVVVLCRRQLVRVCRYTAVVTLLTGGTWLVLQAVAIGTPNGWDQTLSVVRTVMRDTRFGEVVLVRLVLVLAALPFLRMRRLSQLASLALALAAAALQGAVGHAGATGGIEGDGLLASEALHLMAAGAWLGALPALFLLVARLPPAVAAGTCRRFSPIGLSAVLILIGTALGQASALIGSVPALVGTTYGHIALIKLGVFLLLLMIALVNRFSLTARLEETRGISARRWMFVSLTIESLLGVAVIMTAAFLASSAPARHEEPNWPFPWRPSLVALADPDLREEVVLAAVMAGVAVLAVLAGLVWRRARWVAIIVAAVLLLRALPHFGPLFVPAYPTSYYTSPTDFATDSIAHGATLYAANCASCHGTAGYGDGPRAGQLPVHPADLTAPHLWERSDGELFWWLTHGIDVPEGGMTMPGFADKLDPDARWALIDYIRAHNAGAVMAATGVWPVPLHAPSFPIACDRLNAQEVGDLRGSVVYVTASDEAPTPQPAPVVDGVQTVTVRITLGGDAQPAPGTCVAATPSAWPAFAILAGVDPSALAGTAFLIDAAGWLRAVSRRDTPEAWHDQDQLIGAIRQIATHPITAQEANAHAHHH
jgi:putative copper export protein/mono/diheme cytochrome c family protein